MYGGEECFGSEASAHIKSRLASGTQVLYLIGAEATDRYDRALVYLWTADGAFYNAELVRQGYAVPLTIPPNDRYAGLFDRLAGRAENAGRGLWSACGGDPDRSAGGSGGAPAAEGGGCDPNYSGCVPPYPPDVDCADVDEPVEVRGSDPHGLDGNDNGGIGCEGG